MTRWTRSKPDQAAIAEARATVETWRKRVASVQADIVAAFVARERARDSGDKVGYRFQAEQIAKLAPTLDEAKQGLRDARAAVKR